MNIVAGYEIELLLYNHLGRYTLYMKNPPYELNLPVYAASLRHGAAPWVSKCLPDMIILALWYTQPI